MTVTGFNQDVEVLGRVFHLQTQVFMQPQPCIRTEVFHGGKLMARREAPLDPHAEGIDETALRQMMKAQHLKILDSVQKRAQRYQERQQASAGTPAAGAAAAAPPAAPSSTTPTEDALQTQDDGGQVDIALSVRRLFERFRLRVRRASGSTAECLAVAAEQLGEVLASPVFPKIRVDEQVRFHLLHEQLQEWLGGNGSEDLGQQIWEEIGTFNDYLAEVNNRSELAAFDRDLLRWALRKVEEEGIDERTLEHLSMLYGRDLELDHMLDEPQGIEASVWIARFQKVLATLG